MTPPAADRAPTPDPPTPGPVALIAGASRGLGLLIAHELGRRGYRLAICARDADALAEAATRLRSAGCTAFSQVCDVSDFDAVAQFVAATEAELGAVEVAICVAGVIQVGPLAAMRREQVDLSLAIMAGGPVNLAFAVIPGMRRRGKGRFGVISSIGGLVSVPHLVPYCTAKFAAVGFSQGLTAELVGTGVTVTTITPGLLRTGSHLNATFTGRHASEYVWFALSASAPLLAMDAERAARKIVSGVLAGKAFVGLTPYVRLAGIAQGIAPGLTSKAMGIIARIALPAEPTEPGPTATLTGAQIAASLPSKGRRVLRLLTALGEAAADRNNECLPGADAPGDHGERGRAR